MRIQTHQGVDLITGKATLTVDWYSNHYVLKTRFRSEIGSDAYYYTLTPTLNWSNDFALAVPAPALEQIVRSEFPMRFEVLLTPTGTDSTRLYGCELNEKTY